MTRLAALALLVGCALPALVWGADDTRRQLAVAAVNAAYQDRMAGQIMDTYWPLAAELIRLRIPDVTEIQMFRYKGRTGDFAGEAAEAALVPLVDLFEKGFTEAELEALVDFYRSPAGRKVAGAQELIARTLGGAVGDSLRLEIGTFQSRIDAMLAADGH